MSFDDNYEGDFADYAPDDGSVGLPDGHWAHNQEWLTWVDSFAAQLHSDEALLSKFQEWLGTLDESGEQEAAHTPESMREMASKFSRIDDPGLARLARQVARPRDSHR